jgi:lauroyl/myristoyl acyltransferase
LGRKTTFVDRVRALRLAPDGAARPDAPFGRGPLAARVLAKVIDAAAWGGSRLPAGLAHAFADIGGYGEWAFRRSKRRSIAVNMAHALGLAPDAPAVRAAVRRELMNEAHRSADLLWALGRPEEFLASVDLDGIEHAQRATAAGQGAILVGLHLGGWEVATAVPHAVLQAPTTVITADDWLAWAIEHMRTTVGLRVLYRTAPASRAARRLRAGEVLLLLGDDGWGQTPRTHAVRFLDAYADLPAGAVAFSRLCQSPIVGFAVLSEGRRRWRVLVDPPLDPPARHSGTAGEREALQRLADRWSELIRAHPDQWAASYRIPWRSAP